MQAFTKHTGIVAPMDRPNVDTDAIIPKQYLKSIKRTGYGPSAFFEYLKNNESVCGHCIPGRRLLQICNSTWATSWA